MADRPLHQAAYRGNLDRGRDDIRAGLREAVNSEWARWSKQNAVVGYLESVIKEVDHGGDDVDDGPSARPYSRLAIQFDLGLGSKSRIE